jgi:hypothetical protein
MLPLVSVSDFVHQYARGYRDVFSPSLLRHFERYLVLLCYKNMILFCLV